MACRPAFTSCSANPNTQKPCVATHEPHLAQRKEMSRKNKTEPPFGVKSLQEKPDIRILQVPLSSCAVSLQVYVHSWMFGHLSCCYTGASLKLKIAESFHCFSTLNAYIVNAGGLLGAALAASEEPPAHFAARSNNADISMQPRGTPWKPPPTSEAWRALPLQLHRRAWGFCRSSGDRERLVLGLARAWALPEVAPNKECPELFSPEIVGSPGCKETYFYASSRRRTPGAGERPKSGSSGHKAACMSN